LQEIDALIDYELPEPTSATRSGSPDSLMSWQTLGARGRAFVSGGWSSKSIGTFHKISVAMQSIRIYAGLNSAQNDAERARLVLDEMIRSKAFERKVVIIATPTGTGWIDEAAVDPFEIMFRGNTAIVSMQYSYLLSPLTLAVEPNVAPASARALARAVIGHLSAISEDKRPRIFLFGLSLGSYGSEQALSILDWVNAPISGALWSGPTFENDLWKSRTRTRNPGSLVWRPKIGAGETVRFATQKTKEDLAGNAWSKTRIVYLQYPSDPITFFEPAVAFRPSDWMTTNRAPDVSSTIRWYPIVSFFQLAADMMYSSNVPAGFGHLIAAEHYIDSWVALTDPPEWNDQDTKRLKAAFSPN
jgi:uncharacterized membrane protein